MWARTVCGTMQTIQMKMTETKRTDFVDDANTMTLHTCVPLCSGISQRYASHCQSLYATATTIENSATLTSWNINEKQFWSESHAVSGREREGGRQGVRAWRDGRREKDRQSRTETGWQVLRWFQCAAILDASHITVYEANADTDKWLPICKYWNMYGLRKRQYKKFRIRESTLYPPQVRCLALQAIQMR